AFVPTVTVISSSQDLRWMVQPAVITAVSASSARQKSKSQTAAAHKAKPCNRKGHKEKLTPEQKARPRRSAFKIAAAKCRNRRRELIDTLQAETDQLEDEKSALQVEIDELLKEKERLEHVLAFHRPSCKLRDGEGDDEEGGEGASAMLQEAAASSPLLSILENGKSPESSTAGGEALTGQDLDSVSCVPAAAILGNSNILLCSSAEDNDLEDLKDDDLEDLVPSLEMAETSELAAPVPDIDLGGPFCFSDWETLYKSVSNDLDSLCAPVMSSSPTCSNYRTVFSFNYSEIESLAEIPKGSSGVSEVAKDNLNSPTLLAL
uniref:Protein c-Fos n=1 Tax=Tetraodon nigroviridis TaxID=99883 RepID=H3DG08_TETNG